MTDTGSPASGGYIESTEWRRAAHKARETKDDGRYIIFYTFDEDVAGEEGED